MIFCRFSLQLFHFIPSHLYFSSARVTRIVKGFNIDWKNSIEKIHDEIMMEFANFTLGTQIFQVSITLFCKPTFMTKFMILPSIFVCMFN